MTRFLSFISRRRGLTATGTTFCDSCSQVCTPQCRASALRHRSGEAAVRARLGG